MRQPRRRSKIVCTIGPATASFDKICSLIEVGMDVARINFSHGQHSSHKETIHNIREAARKMDVPVAILGDLQGPKIRTGTLLPAAQTSENGFALSNDQNIWFKGSDDHNKVPGDGSTANPISISYPRLAYDLKPGEKLLFDDGLVSMQVEEANFDRNMIRARVIHGQYLGENKGVNMPGSRLSMLGVTEKDWADIAFAIQEEVDILALSFVRGYREIRNLKQFLEQKNQNIKVIAKIEKMEAVKDIDNILHHSDGIMVARGDLAVEVGNDKVPLIQKQLIERARSAAKPVITATQMLLSMVNSPTPTRAEASDVSNAVLDGSDALMLSNETATGKFPLETVQMMARIIEEAEALSARPYWQKGPVEEDRSKDDVELPARALCNAAVKLAHDVNAKCLTCLTRSGRTAQFLAMTRPHKPIFAFSSDPKVRAQLCLTWGVFVVTWNEKSLEDSVVFDDLLGELSRLKVVNPDDSAVMMAGIPTSLKSGTTNTICHKKVAYYPNA